MKKFLRQTLVNLRPLESAPALLSVGLALSSCLAAASCVTVNVNFPESAVQKATDDYVRDIYRSKEKPHTGNGETSTSPKTQPSATPHASQFSLETAPKAHAAYFFRTYFSAGLIAEANAEEPSSSEVFNLKSAKIASITEGLKTRVSEVLDQKKSGLIGEGKDGFVVLRDEAQSKKLLLPRLRKLVESENTDRRALYAEVVSSNNLPPARLVNVQRSFARSFQAESPSGTWVQDETGHWAQKP